MKKIVYLIIFAFPLWVHGQINLTGRAEYRFSLNGYVGSSGSSCGNDITGGLQWIAAEYQNNTHTTLVQGSAGYPNDGHGLRNSNFENNIIPSFTENNKITKLLFRTTRRSRNDAGFCRSTDYTSGSVNLTTCYQSNIDFGSIGLNQPGNANVVITPIVTLSNPDPENDILGSEESIIIPPISGITSQYYTWQYSTNNGGTWFNLPAAYQQQNFLNILANVFINESSHGSPLALRVNTGCNGANSNVLNFFYRKSAPKVVSLSPVPTSCYDASDGSLAILFDRPLLPGEQLSVSLTNTTTNTLYSFPNVTLQNNNTLLLAGLPIGNYTFQLIGFYNGFNTYSPTATAPLNFVIDRPAPVDFAITKTDVWCNGGDDGELLITASGGAGGYFYTLDNGLSWTAFQNTATHNLANLLPGTYTIKVKDSNGCVSKIQTIVNGEILLGDEKEISTSITEPDAPVSINYTLVQQPAFYGGSNGKIVAAVEGGTRFPNDSYTYEWTNSNGTVLTSVTTQYLSGIYYITLDNLVTDTYYLTVRDKNFTAATNQAGCTVAASSQFLGQPEPLLVTFEVEQTISCNAANEFGDESDFDPSDGQRDEAQDGILIANVTGGVPFTGSQNNGLPYIYRWKKQLNDGTWADWADSDSIAQNLSHGNYALNIEDRNGIRLGTYVNNVLVTEIDSTFFMQQPARLELAFETSPVTCSSGNNAWAQANVSGGTPPYSYLWTTGETTQTISGLSANNYFVLVRDARGCTVQGSAAILQSNGVQIASSVSRPTCFGGTDGAIILAISGGMMPYSFVWNTGAATQNLAGISAGSYNVTVTDAEGCTYYFETVIEDNPQIIVDLGPDRTLCNSQSHDLNISIADPGATYSWTSGNGFASNSASVSLTEPGTYLARAVSSVGCIGQDQITITASSVLIDSEFLLTSQAYANEDVILVNTSSPFGEDTEWTIPQGITIVQQTDDFVILNFAAPGMHTIVLKQTQGDCYAFYSKHINVEQRSVLPDPGMTDNPFITEFIVAPNPSSGVFRASIKLKEASPVKLRLFPYTGQAPAAQQSAQGSDEYEINFNVSLAAGTYVLVLETAKQTIIRKIILF